MRKSRKRTAFLDQWEIWLPPSISLLFFAPLLLSGNYIVSPDTSQWTYVLRRWHVDQLLKGDFPLWNDGLFGGIYHVASPGLGLYSPTTLFLYFLFPGYTAHQLAITLLSAIGALGMALWIRRWTQSKIAAVITGIAYALSGYVLSSTHNYGYFAGACIYPWALWAYSRYHETPSWRHLSLVAVCLAWITYEGDPIGMVMMMALLGLHWGMTKKFTDRQHRIQFASGTLMLLCLCALAWLPGLETLSESRRASGLPFDQATFFSMSPIRLLNLFVPGYWGYFYDHSFWGHSHQNALSDPRFWVDSIYFSVPLLVFAAYALRSPLLQKKSERQRQWLFLAALGFLLLSFGHHFAPYPLLHEWLPFFSKLRFPARFFAVTNLCLIALAGLGIRDFFQNKMPTTKIFFAISVFYSVGFLFRVGSAPTQANSEYQTLLFHQVTGGLVLALATVAFFFWQNDLRKREIEKKTMVFLVGLTLLDLLFFKPPFQTRHRKDFKKSAFTIPQDTPRPKLLRDQLLKRLTGNLPKPTTLEPNWALLEGWRYTFGYEPTIARRLDPLLGSVTFQSLPIWSRILGFNYVLTPDEPREHYVTQWERRGVVRAIASDPTRNLRLIQFNEPRPEIALSTSIRLSRNAHESLAAVADRGTQLSPLIVESSGLLWQGNSMAPKTPLYTKLQRSLTSFESNQADEAHFLPNLTHRSNNVRIYQQRQPSQIDQFLVFRERYHSGWRAFADGKEAPLFRTDYFNVGMILPKGTKEIELRFAPKSFSLGLAFFLLGIVFAVVPWVSKNWTQHSRS